MGGMAITSANRASAAGGVAGQAILQHKRGEWCLPHYSIHYRLLNVYLRHFIGLPFCLLTLVASAQRRPLPADHSRAIDPAIHQPAIYFPEAPRPGEWRKSLGAVFTTTPPALTEEIRLSVPAVDFNLQRGLTKRFFVVSRLQTQFIQSNLSLGVRWATPLTDRLFLSVGDDVHGWMGVLKLKDVFNSQAYGVQNMPNLTLGYRLTRELQLSVKGEAITDLYYRSQVGTLAIENRNRGFNGVAFTAVLEQPFYGNRHVSLGVRAAYSNFNWQFWSLFDTFDRDLFYPQLIFNFIL